MEKILRGILKYRANGEGNFLVRWSALAKDQPVKPPVLFISCMDSRVLPTHFCQTSPGDMFILRNAGNVVPRADRADGEPSHASGEAVALEITCNRAQVEHMVVCGHSDCQALYTAYNLYTQPESKTPIQAATQTIQEWSRTHGVEASLNRIKELSSRTAKGATLAFDVGDSALEYVCEEFDPSDERSLLEKLSRINVLQQMEHLSSYRSIRRRVVDGSLGLHGMWYDVATHKVYWFSPRRRQYLEINAENIEEIVEECRGKGGAGTTADPSSADPKVQS